MIQFYLHYPITHGSKLDLGKLNYSFIQLGFIPLYNDGSHHRFITFHIRFRLNDHQPVKLKLTPMSH